MKRHTIALFLATSLAFTALHANATPQQTSTKATAQTTKTYVSDGYHNRNQGYDWVAVETTK